MISYESKAEDAIWLALVLKRELGRQVYIDRKPFIKEMVHGRFYGSGEPAPFFIKCSAGEFLRITVTGDNIYSVKKEALNALAEALMPLNDRLGYKIGYPLASFNLWDGKGLDPFYEWALTNKEEYAQKLWDGSLFEDAKPQDMVIYDSDGTILLDATKPKQY